MTVAEVRAKYLEFFKKRGHTIIPSASLVPENDPTTLFTGSGMQPMVPYLLGETHPQGKRIVDSQKCFRAQDIEEVGDNRHTTFFEMLGNWSLGDYFKKEQHAWVFEFLVDEIKLKPEQLYFTVFAGDEKNGIPRDTESVEHLKRLFKEKGIEAKDVEILTEEQGGKQGMKGGRIFYYDAKKNWWSRAGVPENMPVGEPGGPDSEIFFDFYPEAGEGYVAGFGLHRTKGSVGRTFQGNVLGEFCHPNCDCGRFMEIGNSVFMEYRKVESVGVKLPQDSGSLTPTTFFEKLPQRNVDFGGGLERITAAANNEPDVFKLDVFKKSLEAIQSNSYGVRYEPEVLDFQRAFRIVLDHIRAVTFLIADGILPGHKGAESVVRNLLKQAALSTYRLAFQENPFNALVRGFIFAYKDSYPKLKDKEGEISAVIVEEQGRVSALLEVGFKKLKSLPHITPLNIFDLHQSSGFDVEYARVLLERLQINVDWLEVEKYLREHSEKSRLGSEKKFKGGLADTSEMSLKYHTATHLLHQALRDVLGNEVQQKGSNITPERLRFDFAFGRKMTDEEKRKVENAVNDVIAKKLPVQKVILPKAEAEKTGALHFFGEKYGDEVSVYFVGNSIETAYSKEFCGGPHVTNIGGLGTFRIAKEEAVSAGVRRIKATLS